jgi:hypothetical protein
LGSIAGAMYRSTFAAMAGVDEAGRRFCGATSAAAGRVESPGRPGRDGAGAGAAAGPSESAPAGDLSPRWQAASEATVSAARRRRLAE